MSNRVAIVLGYGPRVGVDVAKALAESGFKVAVVSRSGKHSESAVGYLQLQADLVQPESLENIFTRVIDELGHPSVVIYNAGSMQMVSSNLLGDKIADFQADNNVNIVSAYAAAQLAVRSFSFLPKDLPKAFIYTGNKQPFMIVRPLLSVGVGKAGAAHLIHYLSEEYKDQGFKFYFADERKEDGTPVYADIDGVAHAKFYMHLIEGRIQGPWNATFVKGKGYVPFSETIIQEAVDLSALVHKG
ncbi:hypothetical protein V8C35DRAFT_200978 [Trichoderma chlorosporum]